MDERFLTDVKRERKLTKLVNGPREAIFQAWTDPLQLRTWWGPRGFTAGEVVVQPQPGGKIRVDMRDSDGRTFPMRGVIRDIERPSRLHQYRHRGRWGRAAAGSPQYGRVRREERRDGDHLAVGSHRSSAQRDGRRRAGGTGAQQPRIPIPPRRAHVRPIRPNVNQAGSERSGA